MNAGGTKPFDLAESVGCKAHAPRESSPEEEVGGFRHSYVFTGVYQHEEEDFRRGIEPFFGSNPDAPF